MSGRTWASRLSSTPASRRAEAERGPSRTSYLDLMKTTTRWTSRIILNAEPASKSWPTPGLTLGDRPTTRPQLVLYFYLRYFTWWNTRVNSIFIPVHIQDWTDQPHCLMRTCSYRPRWLPWPPAPPRSSCSRSSTSELFYPYLSHNLRSAWSLYPCTELKSYTVHVLGWCPCSLSAPGSPTLPRSSYSHSSTTASTSMFGCIFLGLRDCYTLCYTVMVYIILMLPLS